MIEYITRVAVGGGSRYNDNRYSDNRTSDRQTVGRSVCDKFAIFFAALRSDNVVYGVALCMGATENAGVEKAGVSRMTRDYIEKPLNYFVKRVLILLTE